MKRLYQEERWVRHSKSRQRYQLKRARKPKGSRQSRHGGAPSPSLNPFYSAFKSVTEHTAVPPPRTSRPIKHVKAPDYFSFINNPEKMIEFLNKIGQQTSKKKNVFIDASDITTLSSDAFILLMSKVQDKEFMNDMGIQGNAPFDAKLQEIFFESPFFNYVQIDKPINRRRAGDMFSENSSVKVNSKIAQNLLNSVRAYLYSGTPIHMSGPYITLVECMSNTFQHASQDAKEKWCAMVYCYGRTAQFSFIDNGVGMMGSRNIPFIRKFLNLFGSEYNPRLLNAMLLGEVPSATGEPNRGKGLPTMHRFVKELKLIRNLIIITNNVYANVERDEYRLLNGHELKGTFLSWEFEN